MNIGKVQEQVHKQVQEKVTKSKKKLRINKQIVTSFLAGMAAMLIFIVGIMAAVNPGFLTGMINDANRAEFGYYKDTGTIVGYYGNEKNIIIPSSIDGIEMKEIEYNAFSYSKIVSITIPNSITSIGFSAFSFCQNLTSIILPNSIKSIGGNMFCGCDNLRNIIIPDSVRYIEGYAFGYCKNLTSITLPKGVESIDDRAFCGCVKLTSITIPNSVKLIGEDAFAGCDNLTIYGSSSYVKRYAKGYDIPYKAQ